MYSRSHVDIESQAFSYAAVLDQTVILKEGSQSVCFWHSLCGHVAMHLVWQQCLQRSLFQLFSHSDEMTRPQRTNKQCGCGGAELQS